MTKFEMKAGLFAAVLLASVANSAKHTAVYAEDPGTVVTTDGGDDGAATDSGDASDGSTDGGDDTASTADDGGTMDPVGGGDDAPLDDPNVIFYSMAGGTDSASGGLPPGANERGPVAHNPAQDTSGGNHDSGGAIHHDNCVLKALGVISSC
jgi:hypothetical protein